MRCSTGKIRYSSRYAAEEALGYLHDTRSHPGAHGIYACEVCGEFHLTSKGEQDASLQQRMQEPGSNYRSEAEYWERKLR